jgi:hypothetical protein
MGGGVMFRPIVRFVEGSRSPEKPELLLVDGSIAEPMEAHIHGFCAFGQYT